MAIDFRKLLIAQMLECSLHDGGWPSVEGLSKEEDEAYDQAEAEAYRIIGLCRARGDWYSIPPLSRDRLHLLIDQGDN